MFHRRGLNRKSGRYLPRRILTEIAGLKDKLTDAQQDIPEEYHQIFENMAVDETFERLGRMMPE